jgi:hypothetical protein
VLIKLIVLLTVLVAFTRCFTSFIDRYLELRFWNATRIDARDSLVSKLNFAIGEKLLASGVSFA